VSPETHWEKQLQSVFWNFLGQRFYEKIGPGESLRPDSATAVTKWFLNLCALVKSRPSSSFCNPTALPQILGYTQIPFKI
jgi:hypothetical protein